MLGKSLAVNDAMIEIIPERCNTIKENDIKDVDCCFILQRQRQSSYEIAHMF